MSILLIAGSPSQHSRSSALLDSVEQRIQGLVGERRYPVDRLLLRELSPQALLLADWGHPSVRRAINRVADAQAVVVATPVYKAAYSGVLKVFLDLLPQAGFKDKVVLPLATGGSPHHMLALDYALRPVLQSLGARQILSGVYASDSQVPKTESGGYQVSEEIDARLADAVSQLVGHLDTRLSGVFPAVHFDQLAYSV